MQRSRVKSPQAAAEDLLFDERPSVITLAVDAFSEHVLLSRWFSVRLSEVIEESLPAEIRRVSVNA